MNTTTLGEQQSEEAIGFRDTRPAPRANVLKTVVGLFLVIAVVAAAGLGVWSYQLNTKLVATQKQLDSLHGDYEQLKADHGKLAAVLSQANSALDQNKSDLAAAKSELTKAQADLQGANRDIAAQRAKIDKAKHLMPIVEGMFASDGSPAAVQAKIYSSGDARLISLWDAVLQRPNDTNLLVFYRYLFGAISAALG